MVSLAAIADQGGPIRVADNEQDRTRLSTDAIEHLRDIALDVLADTTPELSTSLTCPLERRALRLELVELQDGSAQGAKILRGHRDEAAVFQLEGSLGLILGVDQVHVRAVVD